MTRHQIRNHLIATVASLFAAHSACATAPGSIHDRADIRAELASVPVSPQAQAAGIGRELTSRALAAMPTLPSAVPQHGLHLAAARQAAQQRS